MVIEGLVSAYIEVSNYYKKECICIESVNILKPYIEIPERKEGVYSSMYPKLNFKLNIDEGICMCNVYKDSVDIQTHNDPFIFGYIKKTSVNVTASLNQAAQSKIEKYNIEGINGNTHISNINNISGLTWYNSLLRKGIKVSHNFKLIDQIISFNEQTTGVICGYLSIRNKNINDIYVKNSCPTQDHLYSNDHKISPVLLENVYLLCADICNLSQKEQKDSPLLWPKTFGKTFMKRGGESSSRYMIIIEYMDKDISINQKIKETLHTITTNNSQNTVS